MDGGLGRVPLLRQHLVDEIGDGRRRCARRGPNRRRRRRVRVAWRDGWSDTRGARASLFAQQRRHQLRQHDRVRNPLLFGGKNRCEPKSDRLVGFAPGRAECKQRLRQGAGSKLLRRAALAALLQQANPPAKPGYVIPRERGYRKVAARNRRGIEGGRNNQRALDRRVAARVQRKNFVTADVSGAEKKAPGRRDSLQCGAATKVRRQYSTSEST